MVLDQIQIINEIAMRLKSLPSVGKEDLKIAKMWGFSDSQIADLRGVEECEIRQMRAGLGMRPVFKMVDTCAGSLRRIPRITIPVMKRKMMHVPLRIKSYRHRIGCQQNWTGHRIRLLVRACGLCAL